MGDVSLFKPKVHVYEFSFNGEMEWVAAHTERSAIEEWQRVVGWLDDADHEAYEVMPVARRLSDRELDDFLIRDEEGIEVGLKESISELNLAFPALVASSWC